MPTNEAPEEAPLRVVEPSELLERFHDLLRSLVVDIDPEDYRRSQIEDALYDFDQLEVSDE